jgi:hypothetical protein
MHEVNQLKANKKCNPFLEFDYHEPKKKRILIFYFYRIHFFERKKKEPYQNTSL